MSNSLNFLKDSEKTESFISSASAIGPTFLGIIGFSFIASSKGIAIFKCFTEAQPIQRPDGKTEYTCKFTYNAANPKNAGVKTLSFNVLLSVASARYLYSTYLPVKEGERFSRGFI